MYNHDDIVYLASCIDGEGSLTIDIQNPTKNRKTDYYAIRIVIVNTSLNLMNWLESKFGGRTNKRKKIEHRKQVYQWRIHSFKAAELLELCLPYMIIKRNQAEIIIQFMKLKGDSWVVTTEVQTIRRQMYDQIKMLNKMGD